MTQKKRLDVAVLEQGLAESRERAQAYIMAGDVYLNGVKAVKAGQPVRPEDQIEVRSKSLPYVSRGGLKLEKAMAAFPLSLQGLVCMDVGASTGGFTDCMLQNGASRVYSIDVGYGQLAWKLRRDSRVINLERTNFRYVTRDQVPDEIDFASVDVSFISLSRILPVLQQLLRAEGEAVCLIKPQFEAGREKVGKNGVVRDRKVHCEVIERVQQLALDNQFDILGLDFSPVKGPKGNIEYLIYLKKTAGQPVNQAGTAADALVEQSHQVLDGGEKDEDRVSAQS